MLFTALTAKLVKTLDHKVNMYFNLEPISILDIFMPFYKGSS